MVERLEITKALSSIEVRHDDGMAIITFEMMRLPPNKMAMPKGAALQLGVALVGALSPQQTTGAGQRIRVGFDVEGWEVGVIADGLVSLTLTVFDVPLTFKMTPHLAAKLGEQLISAAGQGPQSPPPRALQN